MRVENRVHRFRGGKPLCGQKNAYKTDDTEDLRAWNGLLDQRCLKCVSIIKKIGGNSFVKLNTREFEIVTIVVTNDGVERLRILKKIKRQMKRSGWKYCGDDLEIGRRVGPVNTPCEMFYRKK